MTLLSKQVSRECLRTTDGGRPIITTLEPGDIISFRLKGCRRVFKTTLAACYAVAVKAEVRAAQLAKKARRAK